MHVWNMLHGVSENTGHKNSPKIRYLRTITQLCRALSSQLRHVLTMRKEVVKQQYLLLMSSKIVNFGPLVAEIGWRVWSKFQRVLHLGFVTALTLLSGGQPNFAQFWPSHGLLHYNIHFWRLLLPNWILLGAKFTLHSSLAFYYIGSVTTRHSSSGRQPNFAAFSWGRHLYLAGRPSR